MKQIEFLKGLPASGKSTYSKEKVVTHPGWIRVNKDDIRSMLSQEKHTKHKEDKVIAIETEIIKQAMKDQLNIIVDNTHFNSKHEERIRGIIAEHNSKKQKDYHYEFIMNDSFLDVSYAECIRRDANRSDYVGSGVIYRMWKDNIFAETKTKGKQNKLVFICDLDGTIAERTNRSWFDWDKVDTDSVVYPVATIINNLRKDYPIIYLTGRDGSCYNITKDWLIGNDLFTEGKDLLYSRAKGDNRKDSIVKREIYENHIKDYWGVIAVFDDRTQVVDMWRHIGLTCLQVNWGDF